MVLHNRRYSLVAFSVVGLLALTALAMGSPKDANAQSSTATFTQPATATTTNTGVPSITPTGTNTPFPVCNYLSIIGGIVGTDTLQLNVINSNTSPVYIIGATIHWSQYQAVDVDPLMFVDTLAVYGQTPFWDYNSLVPASSPGQGTGIYTLPATMNYNNGWQTSAPPDSRLQLPGGVTSPVTVTFADASAPLSSNLTLSDFGGTKLTMSLVAGANPTPGVGTPPGGQTCTLSLNDPTPTANLTPTVSPSPCLNANYDLAFLSFQNFGVVQFQITNKSSTPIYISGFNIRWANYSGLALSEVDLNGTNAFVQPPALQLWTGNSTSSPTISSMGIWHTNGSVFANSVSNLWVVFAGTTGIVPGQPSDFNYTYITLANGCVVTLDPSATAVPTSTNTPTPSRTSTPTSSSTLTPSSTVSPTPTYTTTNTSTASDTATTTFTPSVTNTATNTPPITPTILHTDSIGVFRNGIFYLRLHNSTGFADITIAFNPANKPYPVVGDWTGAGFDTIGVYDQNNGQFSLRNSNTAGTPNEQFTLGNPNDQPLSGRWLANATAFGAGVFRPSNGLIYLRNALTSGFADYTMVLGIPGDVGLAGDWNGDGIDSPGVYRFSTQRFYLTDQVCNCAPTANYTLQYGVSGDTPIVGDWIGQGHDGVGLFRQSNGYVYLRNSLTTGYADITFTYGIAGDVPVAGHWQSIYPPKPGNVLVPPTVAPLSATMPTGGLQD